MKSVIALILILATSCARNLTVDGQTYRPYGFANADDRKSPDIEYDVCLGNLFWAVMMSETVVMPLYFAGWSIMEPVGKKPVKK